MLPEYHINHHQSPHTNKYQVKAPGNLLGSTSNYRSIVMVSKAMFRATTDTWPAVVPECPSAWSFSSPRSVSHWSATPLLIKELVAMIQFIFVLLFSVVFGTSVATESGRPDSPTREVPRPSFRPERGVLYRMLSNDWAKKSQYNSGRPHPVVVLGPDYATNGWGTLVVEISHNLKATKFALLTEFFPEGTQIPPFKYSYYPASIIDESSEINVGEARVVITARRVFIDCVEPVLKMKEEDVKKIEGSIRKAHLKQSRHSSLSIGKDIFGLGEEYKDKKNEFVPDENILRKAAMDAYDFRKLKKIGPFAVSTPQCAEPHGKGAPSCAANTLENEMNKLAATPPKPSRRNKRRKKKGNTPQKGEEGGK
ncbi:hypothetical protein APHAL10511_005539 [Amanita phalloides]|nr:hypothetical protein APHAL10511_005539 [Amanita phalloides]